MVLKQVQANNILESGDFDHTDFTISTSNIQVIMDLLSKGFYQSPVDSIVREYCSNCLDSHTEAGVDDPVLVRFSQLEDKRFIEFIDFGVGLSPERVKQVFTVYFESTKRNTNDLVGSFGLGSKSAYAYSDSFFITTVFDGIEYHYLMSKNELGVSRLTLLYQEDTDRGNGTSVKIEIYHTQYSSDVMKFYNACVKQLAYFTRVYIDGGEVVDATEFNKAKIIHGKNFCCSSLQPYNSFHIKLGQCVYEMPWTDLNMATIYTPVAVKFDIGELMPTPNREGIVLTEESTKLIKDRIELVKAELSEIYNDQRKPLQDWKEWFEKNWNMSSRNVVRLDSYEISVSGIIYNSDSNWKLEGLTSNVNKYKFANNWYLDKKITTVLTNVAQSDYTLQIRSDIVKTRRIIYTIKGKYDKYKNKYISTHLHPDDTVWFMKARKIKLRGDGGYVDILKLHSCDRSEWRAKIIEYQKLLDKIWKELPSYDNLVVPKDWVKSQYKKRQSRNLSGKAVCYFARSPRVDNGNYSAFDKETLAYLDLGRVRKRIIYGSKKDKDTLSMIYGMTRFHKNTEVMYTAESNHTKLEEFDNFMKAEEFLDKYNSVFAKTITAWMLNQYIEDNILFFNNSTFIEKYLSIEIGITLSELRAYSEEYWRTNSYYYNRSAIPEEFLKSCWEASKEKKLYDHTIIAKFRKVWDFIDKAGDLQYLKTEAGVFVEESKNVARKIIKDKIKLDFQLNNINNESNLN